MSMLLLMISAWIVCILFTADRQFSKAQWHPNVTDRLLLPEWPSLTMLILRRFVLFIASVDAKRCECIGILQFSMVVIL